MTQKWWKLCNSDITLINHWWRKEEYITVLMPMLMPMLMPIFLIRGQYSRATIIECLYIFSSCEHDWNWYLMPKDGFILGKKAVEFWFRYLAREKCLDGLLWWFTGKKNRNCIRNGHGLPEDSVAWRKDQCNAEANMNAQYSRHWFYHSQKRRVSKLPHQYFFLLFLYNWIIFVPYIGNLWRYLYIFV